MTKSRPLLNITCECGRILRYCMCSMLNKREVYKNITHQIFKNLLKKRYFERCWQVLSRLTLSFRVGENSFIVANKPVSFKTTSALGPSPNESKIESSTSAAVTRSTDDGSFSNSLKTTPISYKNNTRVSKELFFQK